MKLVINGADVELDGRYAKTPLPWVLRDSGTGVSGALTMPATSLQAASEEVVKRDPGLTRAHRSSCTSLIPSASLVI
jgi:hypothetical protein